MDKVVEEFSTTLSAFHVSNVSPSLLDNISYQFCDQTLVLKHVCIITATSRRLIIQPYDTSMIKTIEKLLRQTHSYDCKIVEHSIVVDFPPVSEEYRRSLIDKIKREADDARIKIRGIRKSAVDDFKKYPDSTPQKTRGWQKTIQELTDASIDKISHLSVKKTKDIMG